MIDIATVKNLPGVEQAPDTFTETDFDALVLEHVKEYTIAQVVNALPENTLGPDAIQKRNAELARLLGLTLRRRQRGRQEQSRKNKLGKFAFAPHVECHDSACTSPQPIARNQ